MFSFLYSRPNTLSLSFGTVWIEILIKRRCLDAEMSLSFGTVWIEMSRPANRQPLIASLSFGTVWIEIA